MIPHFGSPSQYSLNLPSPQVGLSDESNDSFFCQASNSQPLPGSFMSSQQPNEKEKTNQRRMKNRESAARSRERIKYRMYALKSMLDKTEDMKEKCCNRKKLIMNEVEELEARMLELSMGKFASPERDQPDMDNTKLMMLPRASVIMAPQ